MAEQNEESNTLTKADITLRVHEALGVSTYDAHNLVEQTLEAIKVNLVNGDGRIKVPGFGSFLVRRKSARIGRNPKTTEEMTISKRRVLVFKPSPILRALLTKGRN